MDKCKSNIESVSNRCNPMEKNKNLNGSKNHPHLLAPPASGDTTMLSAQSGMFSLIHLSTAGSA